MEPQQACCALIEPENAISNLDPTFFVGKVQAKLEKYIFLQSTKKPILVQTRLLVFKHALGEYYFFEKAKGAEDPSSALHSSIFVLLCDG